MKETKPTILSKKEVEHFINDGIAVYDSAQSKAEHSEIYKFEDGRILYKRKDGKGVLWASKKQFNQVLQSTEEEVKILNFENWILNKNSLDSVAQSSIIELSQRSNTQLDYSDSSLDIVSDLKITDVNQDKELIFAMCYFSCRVLANRIKGNVDVEPINHTIYYRPLVKDGNGNTFYPYTEFLNSIGEESISLKESIEIEMNKYGFMK